MTFTRGEAVRPDDEACPFCGSRRLRIKPVWKTWWFVACECKAAGSPGRTLEDAWANWNHRAEGPVEDRQQALF